MHDDELASRWAELLDALAQACANLSSPAAVRREVEQRCPALAGEIMASRRDRDLLDAWGRCTVRPDPPDDPVVPLGVHAYLHAELAGTRESPAPRFPHAHAGLAHVYGYLLSAVPTAFGLKRERWLDGQAARAFGLPRSAFAPWGAPGTMLGRVTSAAGPVLDDPARFAPLGWLDTRAVPAAGPAVLTRAVVIGTQVSMAMVYGYREAGERWRLVTVFPLAAQGLAALDVVADPWRPRYHAVVPVDLREASVTPVRHV